MIDKKFNRFKQKSIWDIWSCNILCFKWKTFSIYAFLLFFVFSAEITNQCHVSISNKCTFTNDTYKITTNGKCEIEEQNFRRAADDVIFSNGRYNQFLPIQYTYLVHQYHCKFTLHTYLKRVYCNKMKKPKIFHSIAICTSNR